MKRRGLIDTNLIIRFLTQDQKQQAAIAAKMFGACERDELQLVLLPAVLAECVFVLESFYQYPRNLIADTLKILITAPGTEIQNEAQQIQALEFYAATKLHFVDCMLAATSLAINLPLITFDRKLQKLTHTLPPQ